MRYIVLVMLLCACGVSEPPSYEDKSPNIIATPETAFFKTNSETFEIEGFNFMNNEWAHIGPISWIFIRYGGFIPDYIIVPFQYSFTGPFKGKLRVELKNELLRGSRIRLCLILPSMNPPIVCMKNTILVSNE